MSEVIITAGLTSYRFKMGVRHGHLRSCAVWSWRNWLWIRPSSTWNWSSLLGAKLGEEELLRSIFTYFHRLCHECYGYNSDGWWFMKSTAMGFLVSSFMISMVLWCSMLDFWYAPWKKMLPARMPVSWVLVRLLDASSPTKVFTYCVICGYSFWTWEIPVGIVSPYFICLIMFGFVELKSSQPVRCFECLQPIIWLFFLA